MKKARKIPSLLELEVERSPRGGRSARPTGPAISVGFSKRKTSTSIRFSRARQTVALLTSNKKGPENRACFFIGGGENRTLVLGKRHIDDYMLSALLLS